MSAVVPGTLHPSNTRFVLDWNSKGLLAYACHSFIFIVDAFTQKRIQVLDLHKSAVSHLAWSPSPALLSEPQTQRIASADISGQIVIGDPKNGNKLAAFSFPNSTVTAFAWFVWKDLQRDFLIVLHSQTTFVLWNADTGEKVWSFSFLSSLSDFSLDPFSPEVAAFIAKGNGILVVNDIDLSTPPSGSAKLIPLDIQATEEVQTIKHLPAYQNILLTATRTRIMAVHQELACVFFKIDSDHHLVSILPMRSRDAFISVSNSGACTLWRGKYTVAPDRVDGLLQFERVSWSEGGGRGMGHRSGAGGGPGALGGGGRGVMAASLCPSTNSTLALLHTNGRVIFWQLESDLVPSLGVYRSVFADELFSFDSDLETKPIGSLSFRQSAMCSALGAGVTCIRVSPLEVMLKTANDSNNGHDHRKSIIDEEHLLVNRHLAAIGTSAGTLYLVDVFTREILKEFTVQSSPIRCVEWTSCDRVLTAGFNHPLSTTNAVRNDLFSTDIRTGISTRVRPENDESPITMLRVSFYRSYLALAFEREPLEVWDVRSMRLLRRMSKACPLIKDMAWSCKHCTVKKTEGDGIPVFRENLVVLDSDNRLYHIVVKGLHVKDGKEVSTQWKSGGWTIRCMAWKGDLLAMGDADGRLVVWDLAKRDAKNTRVERSPILRMQFSRLAGDQTLAVLHQTELILLETESLTRTQVIQLDRGRAAVDFDLCGVTPILITNDNMMWYAAESPSLGSSMTSSTLSSSPIHRSVLSDQKLEVTRKGFFEDHLSSSIPIGLQAYSRRNLTNQEDDKHSILKEFHWARWSGNHYVADALNIVLNCLGRTGFDQLPPHLQIFWKEFDFQERETRIIGGCSGIREMDEEKLVERAVVLGTKAKRAAVDRLIGSASGDVRLSSYKAALLVSKHDDEHSKSLIKLIATNLIANDLVGEGVELLFLVGAGADACRYLQSQRQWLKAAHYAKMGLSGDELARVLEKTLTFLSVDQRSNSLLWECSFKRWSVVRKLLSSHESLSRIGLLLPKDDVLASEDSTSQKETE